MRTGLLLLILAAQLGKADGVRFALLSDTHFGGAFGVAKTDTERSNNCVYVATNFLPQFVLTTGDVTDTGGIQSQYVTFSNVYRVAFTERGIPWYVNFGNHDGTSADETDVDDGLSNWVATVGYTNFVFTNFNYRFIGLGSLAVPNTAGGQISTGMLNFLEASLSNAPVGSVSVVMTHHPISSTPYGEFSPGFPWNILSGNGLERLSSLLTAYRVPLFFHGHTHWESNTTTTVLNGDTRQIAIPSLSYSWTNGGGGPGTTFGVGAFSIVTITNRQMITKQYKADAASGYPLIGIYTNSVPYYGFGTRTSAARVGSIRGP